MTIKAVPSIMSKLHNPYLQRTIPFLSFLLDFKSYKYINQTRPLSSTFKTDLERKVVYCVCTRKKLYKIHRQTAPSDSLRQLSVATLGTLLRGILTDSKSQ